MLLTHFKPCSLYHSLPVFDSTQNSPSLRRRLNTLPSSPNPTNLPKVRFGFRPAKWAFALCTLTFIIIELGFFHLASIRFTDYISLTAAKCAVTLASVTWHTLAALVVKDVILHVFSVEWMQLYHRIGIMAPGQMDLVSRLTAGFFDHIHHALSSTLSFRLAFIGSLLVLAIGGLGPSAITVSR